MDMSAHLRRLFSYDDWANREVLAALRSSRTAPDRPVKLMAHIFAAERLWLERLEQKKQSVPVWPEVTLQQCDAEAAELPRRWKKYLQGMTDADLALTISYKNSKGESWNSRKEDILLHVIMHSAYHRGQIAADMRALGFTPAYTDFIHGVRQGLVE
jgi:uncharacterized damage-inducible protein DinB